MTKEAPEGIRVSSGAERGGKGGSGEGGASREPRAQNIPSGEYSGSETRPGPSTAPLERWGSSRRSIRIRRVSPELAWEWERAFAAWEKAHGGSVRPKAGPRDPNTRKGGGGGRPPRQLAFLEELLRTWRRAQAPETRKWCHKADEVAARELRIQLNRDQGTRVARPSAWARTLAQNCDPGCGRARQAGHICHWCTLDLLTPITYVDAEPVLAPHITPSLVDRYEYAISFEAPNLTPSP